MIHPKLKVSGIIGAILAVLAVVQASLDAFPKTPYIVAGEMIVGLLLSWLGGYAKAGGAAGVAVDQGGVKPPPAAPAA